MLHRVLLLTAPALVLVPLLSAGPAPAFDDQDGSFNLAGAVCLNPADAAEKIFTEIFCNADGLNDLPPFLPIELPSEVLDEREQLRFERLTIRACREYERDCKTLAQTASRCHNGQINLESRLLRRADAAGGTRAVNEERRNNNRDARDRARAERTVDPGLCSAIDTDYVDLGGSFRENVFRLTDLTPMQGISECFDCAGLHAICVQGLADSTRTVREAIGDDCGNLIGTCFVAGVEADPTVFCDPDGETTQIGNPQDCVEGGLGNPNPPILTCVD